MFPIQVQITLDEKQVISLFSHFDGDQVFDGPQDNDYIVIIQDIEELNVFTYLVNKLNKKK